MGFTLINFRLFTFFVGQNGGLNLILSGSFGEISLKYRELQEDPKKCTFSKMRDRLYLGREGCVFSDSWWKVGGRP